MSDSITSVEAARLLGKTRQWVAELCRRGLLDCQRIGRDWVINRESVEQYKASQQPPEEKEK
jgi:excisionase family DNA binding protein